MARRNANKGSKTTVVDPPESAGLPAFSDPTYWGGVPEAFGGNVSSPAPVNAPPKPAPTPAPPTSPATDARAKADTSRSQAPRGNPGMDLASQVLGMFFGGAQPAAPNSGKSGAGFGNASYGGGRGGDESPGDAGLQGQNPYGSFINGEYIPGEGGQQGAFSGGSVSPFNVPVATGPGAAGLDQLFGGGTPGQDGANGVDSYGTNGGINMNGYSIGGSVSPSNVPAYSGGGSSGGSTGGYGGGGVGDLLSWVLGNFGSQYTDGFGGGSVNTGHANAPFSNATSGGNNVSFGNTQYWGSQPNQTNTGGRVKNSGGYGGGGGFFGGGGFGPIINQNY